MQNNKPWRISSSSINRRASPEGFDLIPDRPDDDIVLGKLLTIILGTAILFGCQLSSRQPDDITVHQTNSFASLDHAALRVVQHRTPFTSSYIFAPNDGKRHPGIVLLHGSEGGSQKNMWVHAILLAEQGFAVMNFCWWDCGRDVRSEPMPMMTNIELQDTLNAIQWFQRSDYVNSKIAIYGISKGAELAMILASSQDKLPFRIEAVAVHSPNDVVEPGSNINWLDKRCWICPVGIQDCSYKQQYWNRSCGKLAGTFKPKDFDTLPMWQWNGHMFKLGSRIEFENYKGPVLITAGENDTDWKSDKDRVKRIFTALQRAGRHPEVHVFQGEEHSFGVEAEQRRKALVNLFFKKHLD